MMNEDVPKFLKLLFMSKELVLTEFLYFSGLSKRSISNDSNSSTCLTWIDFEMPEGMLAQEGAGETEIYHRMRGIHLPDKAKRI